MAKDDSTLLIIGAAAAAAYYFRAQLGALIAPLLPGAASPAPATPATCGQPSGSSCTSAAPSPAPTTPANGSVISQTPVGPIIQSAVGPVLKYSGSAQALTYDQTTNGIRCVTVGSTGRTCGSPAVIDNYLATLQATGALQGLPARAAAVSAQHRINAGLQGISDAPGGVVRATRTIWIEPTTGRRNPSRWTR